MMPRISKSTLPAHSDLWHHHQPGDFLDCYSCRSTLPPQQAVALAMSMPGWARGLLWLRNVLVRPFGLKTGPAERSEDSPLFPVTVDQPDELVLGNDDKHLNFRITLLRDQGRIYMSTWVHPNNIWGRAYLTLVMPFHILIVRGAIGRVARAG